MAADFGLPVGGAAVSPAMAAGVDGVGGSDGSLPSSGARFDRMRGKVLPLGGPDGGPDSIAEKGLFGGAIGEGGGGPWGPLPIPIGPIDLDGDAVCALGGGGVCAAFSGSAPTYSHYKHHSTREQTDAQTFLFTHFFKSLS